MQTQNSDIGRDLGSLRDLDLKMAAISNYATGSLRKFSIYGLHLVKSMMDLPVFHKRCLRKKQGGK